MAGFVGQNEAVPSTPATAPNVAEYQLLSRYFVSAGLPILLHVAAEEDQRRAKP